VEHHDLTAVTCTTPEPIGRPGGQPPRLATPRARKPEWLRVVRVNYGESYRALKQLVGDLHLHTVCEEARCPNIYECWNARTATFMILGDTCTRACRFCAIKTGRPTHLDLDEPRRVAEAIHRLGLDHAVITSVNRDELHDGGASIFAATIRAIRARLPDCGIEVLIPDFKGDPAALQTVIDARPDILNHKLETVPRLYRRIQPWDAHEVSIELLRRAKDRDPALLTKSGLMVGLGERYDEILDVLRELAAIALDILTIGQYLPPSQRHAPLDRYYTPDEFHDLKRAGEAFGIRHVESGPLVRSSYHARDQHEQLRRQDRNAGAQVAE
jgi:lipoic acid synthetase